LNTHAISAAGSPAATLTIALRTRAPPSPSHGPNGGVADSLDEAKTVFRAAWDAQERAHSVL
jgi:hypothetical protein